MQDAEAEDSAEVAYVIYTVESLDFHIERNHSHFPEAQGTFDQYQ